MVEEIVIETRGKGLYEFTAQVEEIVRRANARDGLCTVFITHTSASLIIQENADPSAKSDLEAWLDRHVPENDRHFSHTAEGPDDMPSHIRSVLTSTSLGIPIMRGRLVLGTWQGIYLWEHRRAAHRRRIVVHVISDS